MADKPRVLFLCTANACRSQMAEGWLRHLAGERIEALSAGVHPRGLDPRALRVMGEVGVDLSDHRSDPIEPFLEDPPDLVVTVCDAAAESCPALPARTAVLHWPFPDPAAAAGGEEEVLGVFRDVRDRIRARIAAWLAQGAEPLPIAR